jgi:hypothetical protein
MLTLMTEEPNGKALNSEEQALIVYIRLKDEKFGTPEERNTIYALEDEMIRVVEKSGAGEYDGNEIGEGFFTMYLYGVSASRLWEVTSPVLNQFQASSGSCNPALWKGGCKTGAHRFATIAGSVRPALWGLERFSRNQL